MGQRPRSGNIGRTERLAVGPLLHPLCQRDETAVYSMGARPNLKGSEKPVGDRSHADSGLAGNALQSLEDALAANRLGPHEVPAVSRPAIGSGLFSRVPDFLRSGWPDHLGTDRDQRSVAR